MRSWLESVQSIFPQRTSLSQLMFVPVPLQLLLAMLLVLGISYRIFGQITNPSHHAR